jgi:hypothetical protein
MNKTITKLVVIRPNFEGTIYKHGQVDLEVSSGDVLRSITDLLHLSGEYELFVKVRPDALMKSTNFDPETILVMARNIDSKSKISS